jgi:O-antigen ligase
VYPVPAGPSPAERTALRVLQAGALLVVLSASTYKVFELDRFFVPKELVLHGTGLVAGILTLGAIRRIRGTRVDVLLLAFLLLSAVSALLATNVWLAMRAVAVTASGLAVFWAARGVREAGLARPLLTALSVAVVLGAATSLAQTYGVRTDWFSMNRAPGGTLGNRNFIAHLAAFGLPLVLLSALRAWRGAGYAIGAVAVALVTASLVLTRSRAAWLAFGAVALVFAFSMLASRPLRRNGRTWLRGAGILLVAGGGVAAALTLPNTLRWNSENPYLESVKGVANYQEGSGRGRLIQYQRSLRMAVFHPLLGVGPGNWAVRYPEYAARRDPSMDPNTAGATSNPWPSSDWVAVAAERGFVALGVLALAFAGLAIGGLHRLIRARDADEALGAAALLATLVAANVAGAFDAVLLLALPSLLVWATLGALWSPEPDGRQAISLPVRRLALVFAALAAGAGAVRSGAQLAGMGLFATRGDTASLRRAAQLDPGNYRIRLRLARSGGRRAERCEHARAARDLYPNAAAARAAAARCPRKEP